MFSVYGIETDNLCLRANIQETKIAALENVLDKDFVRRFLIEQKHTYEEPVTEIKTRYPNLKGCNLRITQIHEFAKLARVSDKLQNSETRLRSPFDRLNLICLSSTLRILGFLNN